MKKSIILCADDFGLNAGISSGILDLVHLSRLTATSCMVNGPQFSIFAKDLLPFKDKLQIGLHFNLTEGNLVSDKRPCLSLNQVLLRSHLGLISPKLIADEFNAQLDAFINAFKCLPDFIDGHQHIHQFPILRSVILKIYQQRLTNQIPIRSTFPAILLKAYRRKTNILALSGGRRLEALLQRQGIPHNVCFAGIYDFAPTTDYRNLFRQWLHVSRENTLIMCHPAEHSGPNDPIAAARQLEMNYFKSDDFLEDCQTFQVSTTGPIPGKKETVDRHQGQDKGERY